MRLQFLVSEENREIDVRTVLFDNLPYALRLCKFKEVLFERGDDFRSAFRFFAFFNRKVLVARARPVQTLAVPAFSVDINLVGDHKYAVEAHAELPDKPVGEVALAFLQRFHKRLRARVGDCAEVRNKLLFGHAYAKVFNRECARLFVACEFYLQLAVGDFPARRKLGVAQFFGRVGCVRNKFPYKNLLVGVKRVYNDVEYLFYFCLEFIVHIRV